MAPFLSSTSSRRRRRGRERRQALEQRDLPLALAPLGRHEVGERRRRHVPRINAVQSDDQVFRAHQSHELRRGLERVYHWPLGGGVDDDAQGTRGSVHVEELVLPRAARPGLAHGRGEL